MNIDELNYDLPPERIATHPADPRDASRLLVYYRSTGRAEHHRFAELPDLLEPSDLLVVNNTRVLPAKLILQKPSGSLIPGLFLHEEHLGRWEVMLRSRGRLAVGTTLASPHGEYRFHVVARAPEKGHWFVEVDPPRVAAEILATIGHVPLPPYIEKARGAVPENPADKSSYQTVFAQEQLENQKSLAAPTAGLHFTPSLLERLHGRGIGRADVTLHVGLGTFLPVHTATLEEHPMHTEEYAVPVATIQALREQRRQGRRIVAVGTTATRTLEAAAALILNPNCPPTDIHASTNLLISPGYHFQLTDVLITNFHLPRSTLLALVAALIGLDKLKSLYQLAIAEKYRFYSYGDAMLILP